MLRVRLAGWWQSLRDSLWLIPSVGVLSALLVGGVLTQLEPWFAWIPSELLFAGTPEGARAILSQLAGATITVVALVFSLTVVALQIASSQFTPRLLRTFLRDRRVQLVLSGMIGSAVFDIAVLRAVRSAGDGVAPFVPRLAVSTALLAAFGAVGLLIYYLHYVTQHLRVDVVMDEIVQYSLGTIVRAPQPDDGLPDQVAPDPPDDATPIWSRVNGYLQLTDADWLAARAREAGIRIRLRPTLGEWVTQGTTLAWVWSDGERDTVGDRDEIADVVHRAIHLGRDRTESTDLAYGLRQLQDVATRALSPGINDPTTATLAISQMSAVMCRYAELPLGDHLVADDDGESRVAAPRPGFSALLELAVGGARRYGSGDPDVLAALLTLLIDVAEHVADTADRSDVVRAQVDRIVACAEVPDAEDRARIERVAGLARLALDRGTRRATLTEAG